MEQDTNIILRDSEASGGKQEAGQVHGVTQSLSRMKTGLQTRITRVAGRAQVFGGEEESYKAWWGAKGAAGRVLCLGCSVFL